MSILNAVKAAKKKIEDSAVSCNGLEDNLVFTCILRNLGVSFDVCNVLETWAIDEREDIVKHAELGIKFYFEG